MVGEKDTFFAMLFGIAMGLGGELHIGTGAFGTIAMLDLASYALAVPIILTCWHKMGSFMRKSMVWAFAWTGAAMISNMANFIDMRYWAKCVALASSSWAIMAVSYCYLRGNARRYLWYLIGAGLGGWISLYYFRNGALEAFALGHEFGYWGEFGSSIENLAEKQVYPNIARGILFGIILPLFVVLKQLPVFMLLGAVVGAGFWLLLHGGSRSSFGMFCGAAGVGLVVAYAKEWLYKIGRKPVLLLALAAIAVSGVFLTYKVMAEGGALGDSERRKYEREFGKGGSGLLEGRSGFDAAFEHAIESNGIGKGGHLRCHSVIANSLACEGIIGFLFWIYFYAQCFWFVRNKIPQSGRYSTFIVLMMLFAMWDVLGSPFGTRHKFFVLMSFIALCRDDPAYGYGDFFLPSGHSRKQGWGV